ncbi:hypothetical protein BDK51DRAFT_39145 [Blyttiomyces helicus]|uniref:Uncharacterized protein n=1 Tax=Blyttiomyces helicus TaxID=388810 RepID=A0A4P9VXB7_9FUNG|nr:hypothetical protein BDK51DRAFT_39145 [Blyttiomyces helicus]|eukprot:RKO84361.1 hypothetical protein BDK51DRAFT_39145 [Blyttiomyces helicus]
MQAQVKGSDLSITWKRCPVTGSCDGPVSVRAGFRFREAELSKIHKGAFPRLLTGKRISITGVEKSLSSSLASAFAKDGTPGADPILQPKRPCLLDRNRVPVLCPRTLFFREERLENPKRYEAGGFELWCRLGIVAIFGCEETEGWPRDRLSSARNRLRFIAKRDAVISRPSASIKHHPRANNDVLPQHQHLPRGFRCPSTDNARQDRPASSRRSPCSAVRRFNPIVATPPPTISSAPSRPASPPANDPPPPQTINITPPSAPAPVTTRPPHSVGGAALRLSPAPPPPAHTRAKGREAKGAVEGSRAARREGVAAASGDRTTEMGSRGGGPPKAAALPDPRGSRTAERPGERGSSARSRILLHIEVKTRDLDRI